VLLEGLRTQVLEIARAMSRKGMVSGTWGNVSARDAETGHVAVTPSTMDYDKLRPEDIIVVDRMGKAIEGQHKPSSETPMHTLIYRKKNDVHGIVHTHSPYATALAVAGMDLPSVIVDLPLILKSSIAVADYATPGTEALGEQVIKAMDKTGARGALLQNHGAIAVGPDLIWAFRGVLTIEDAARNYCLARFLGNVTVLSEDEVNMLATILP
jgi:L-ribulose-5-phosphate 4-epimerase